VLCVFFSAWTWRCYQRHLLAQSFDATSAQATVGLGVLNGVQTVAVLGSCTAVLYVTTAVLFYLAIQSVILLTAMMVGPFLFAAIACTYMQCVKTDWRLVSHPRYRNPPLDSLHHALLCGGLPTDDYWMLLSVTIIVLLLVLIALVISLTVAPTYIGWSIAFVLFIALTTLLPVVKVGFCA
jgi:hypothetical protein